MTEARTEMKIKLREFEGEWWDDIIQRCEEASQRVDIGGKYSALKSLGDKSKKASEGHNTTTADFKEHFQQVSQDSYERGAEGDRGSERSERRRRQEKLKHC